MQTNVGQISFPLQFIIPHKKGCFLPDSETDWNSSQQLAKTKVRHSDKNVTSNIKTAIVLQKKRINFYQENNHSVPFVTLLVNLVLMKCNDATYNTQYP